jgi:hypothetical protein
MLTSQNYEIVSNYRIRDMMIKITTKSTKPFKELLQDNPSMTINNIMQTMQTISINQIDTLIDELNDIPEVVKVEVYNTFNQNGFCFYRKDAQ